MSKSKEEPANPRPRKRRFFRGCVIRLMTVSVALVIALLIAEIGVRILAPQDLSGTWRRTDSYGIFVNQKNHSARHQQGDRVVKYRFNSEGLRDLGQGDGQDRILCLGDSFTFGWLLSDEHTYISKLQEKSKKEFGDTGFVLLNGGHGGWGTSDYVRFFEEYGDDFQVTGVIVFLSHDDIGRSLRNPKYDLMNDDTLQPTTSNLKKDGFVKRTLNATPVYPWLLENCHLLQLARNAMVAAKHRAKDQQQEFVEPSAKKLGNLSESLDPTETTKANRLARALFKRLKKITDDRSIELLVLTTGFHQKSSSGKYEPTRDFMSTAKEIFAEEGITFFDCTDELSAKIQNDYSSIRIVDDTHPNEDGARLIAEVNWPAVQSYLNKLDKKNKNGNSSDD